MTPCSGLRTSAKQNPMLRCGLGEVGTDVGVEERVVLDEVGADRKADKEGRDDVKKHGTRYHCS